MSSWLIGLVAVIYMGVAVSFILKGQVGWAICFIGYVIGNIGIIMANLGH